MPSVLATSIFTVKPGHDEELVTQWRELADWIVARSRGGARPPSLYRDRDRPSCFVATVEWDSLESLNRCRQDPEFQRRVGALLAGPVTSVEEATADAIVSLAEQPVLPRQARDAVVSGYSGPLSSPWAVPLPKTLAEARSLKDHVPVGVEKPLTAEAFLQYLVGVWVLRSADDVYDSGGMGLAIYPDGRWAELSETDGELHRSTGWDTEGSWRVHDTWVMNGPGVFQVSLSADGGGGHGLGHPIFATSLPLMRVPGRMQGVEYLKLDQPLPEAPAKPTRGVAASVEGATVEAVASPSERHEPPRRARDDVVSRYRGPLSSPWTCPLPKTVAEARSLGQHPPEGVEKPLELEVFLQYLVGVWVVCTVEAVNQNLVTLHGSAVGARWGTEPRPLKGALGELGLVIDADGRWAALIEADGQFYRSTRSGTDGTWQVRDTRVMNGPGAFHLSLTANDGSDVGIFTAIFASSVPLMRFHGPAGVVAHGPERPRGTGVDLQYVRLDQPIPEVCPKPGSQ